MFQACVCPLLVQLHTPQIPFRRHQQRLRSANIVLRAPVMANDTPLACRHSMVKWSGISSFLKAKRSRSPPAVRVPGVSREAALASAFSTPRRLHTLQSFCVILHIVQTCFPSFLTMPYLKHIDVISACISELSDVIVIASSLARICFFLCFLKYCSTYPLISPHRILKESRIFGINTI